jgi:hypothetical protein
MIACYCRGVHGSRGPLCEACQALLDYAGNRLVRCPFGGKKPVCAQCPIHCYQPRMRETMKQVMRYAGPRLLLRHPVLTLRHWLDARRPPPASGPDKGAGKG